MTYSAVNTIWVLIGAALVFFMQAGFSMCEAGFTRAKNTGNILMKNLMDFCIGTLAFFAFRRSPLGICRISDRILCYICHHRFRGNG